MAREFKDSGIEWIGQIPKEWEVCQIRRVMKNRSERNLPNAEVLSLYRDWGIVPKNSRDDNHNVTSEDTTNYKVVHKGDFVINKMKAWQGSMAVSDYDGIISPAYYVCEFVRTSVYKRYIHHLLRNESYKTEYMRLSSGLRVGQWDLNIENFLRIPMILPSFSEQQKIADYLDKVCGEVDEMVALQETMIEELKAYKQSVITEAVTKGLDPNTPMRNSGIDWIGEIPEGWEVCRIKNIFNVSDGTHDTPNYVDKSCNTYPLVTSKCIIDGEIVLDLANHISETDYIQINERSFHNRYDVIMPMIGTVGNPAIVMTDDKYALKNVAIFRTGGDYYKAALLKYFINSYLFIEQYNSTKRGGVQNFISQDIIRNLILIIPQNLEETIIFLDTKCSGIDSLIALKQAKIEELKEYKKSVIYEYVTGKKEVQ